MCIRDRNTPAAKARLVRLKPSAKGLNASGVGVTLDTLPWAKMCIRDRLIITCAVYTIRNGLPSSPLYALCIGPVLLSMAVGSGLAELLGPALSDDLAHWTNVILLCVVLLSVCLLYTSRCV